MAVYSESSTAAICRTTRIQTVRFASHSRLQVASFDSERSLLQKGAISSKSWLYPSFDNVSKIKEILFVKKDEFALFSARTNKVESTIGTTSEIQTQTLFYFDTGARSNHIAKKKRTAVEAKSDPAHERLFIANSRQEAAELEGAMLLQVKIGDLETRVSLGVRTKLTVHIPFENLPILSHVLEIFLFWRKITIQVWKLVFITAKKCENRFSPKWRASHPWRLICGKS